MYVIFCGRVTSVKSCSLHIAWLYHVICHVCHVTCVVWSHHMYHATRVTYAGCSVAGGTENSQVVCDKVFQLQHTLVTVLISQCSQHQHTGHWPQSDLS